MDRVRLDVFGPFSERNCLIMTDTFSGWVEVKSIDNFDVQNILRILRNWFAQFGIPKQVCYHILIGQQLCDHTYDY